MKVYYKLSRLLPFLFILIACNRNGTDSPVVLAKTFDKYLYLSDIENIFPQGISKTDSIQILNAYVDQWVRRRLLLRTAEKNLAEDQKNVAKQLEDYRSSLLIFKYEQEFIAQRMDTVVSSQEIEIFYKENLENFTLSEAIVKALYIKIPKGSPYIDKIRSVYKSSAEDDVKALDDLAYQVAEKYDYFNDQWVQFSLIAKKLPYSLEVSSDEFLRKNKTVEMEDGDNVYFLRIRKVLFSGDAAPLDFERNNIESVLLNKRKQKIINDLENRIYNDAINHKQFTVF